MLFIGDRYSIGDALYLMLFIGNTLFICNTLFIGYGLYLMLFIGDTLKVMLYT